MLKVTNPDAAWMYLVRHTHTPVYTKKAFQECSPTNNIVGNYGLKNGFRDGRIYRDLSKCVPGESVGSCLCRTISIIHSIRSMIPGTLVYTSSIMNNRALSIFDSINRL